MPTSSAPFQETEWQTHDREADASRAVREYLATLDDAAFGAASDVTPKFVSPSDPAAQWTGAHKGHAFFAYATNYLIDTQHAIILDVEATRAIRQAEVGLAHHARPGTAERFSLKPQCLAGDSAYGSAENLAWLVKQRQIAPHIPVFDKSHRTDGTFSRSDFVFDAEQDHYTCPAESGWCSIGAASPSHAPVSPRMGSGSTGPSTDCQSCALKARCCPNTPRRRGRAMMKMRVMSPGLWRRHPPLSARHYRKKIEMLFAHLKRILRLVRLRLRGPSGARDEFLLAATAQNLRRLASSDPCQPLPELGHDDAPPAIPNPAQRRDTAASTGVPPS